MISFYSLFATSAAFQKIQPYIKHHFMEPIHSSRLRFMLFAAAHKKNKGKNIVSAAAA
jgi:hypothetical protein